MVHPVFVILCTNLLFVRVDVFLSTLLAELAVTPQEEPAHVLLVGDGRLVPLLKANSIKNFRNFLKHFAYFKTSSKLLCKPTY